MTPTGQCRSCGAPIVWVTVDATGRSMPLDPNPSPRGNVWVVKHGRKVHVVVAAAPRSVPEGEPAYLSHFATCPEGPSWRRKR